MPRLKHVTFLTLVVGLVSNACGGSTSEASGSSGGASSTGGNGAGGATGCDVINATGAQVKLCESATNCAKNLCTTDLAQCMGAQYAQGIYSGASCSDYANCVKNCNCVSACSANCVLSDACGTCLQQKLLVCVIQTDCAPIAYQCWKS